MFTHILIPTDGDPGSRRAIECGVELARSLGARITGFHAMTEFAHPGIVEELLEPPADELQRLAHEHAEGLLEEIRNRAGRAGVTCKTTAARGDVPWEAIVEAAKRHRCDLIVIASHGRRGIARLVLGSQTQKVLDHTNVSVLVVR